MSKYYHQKGQFIFNIYKYIYCSFVRQYFGMCYLDIYIYCIWNRYLAERLPWKSVPDRHVFCDEIDFTNHDFSRQHREWKGT